ncbi:unnamed protein product [Mortierella alpina]
MSSNTRDQGAPSIQDAESSILNMLRDKSAQNADSTQQPNDQMLFKHNDLFMDQGLDYQAIDMDKNQAPNQHDACNPLYGMDHQHLEAYINNHSQFLGLSSQFRSTSMSYTSPMDLCAIPSSSSCSETSPANLTPSNKLDEEEGSQSRKSSLTADECGEATKALSSFYLEHAAADTKPAHSQHSAPDAFGSVKQQQQHHQHQPSLSVPMAPNASIPNLHASGPQTEGASEEEDPAIRRAEQNRAAQRAFRQRKQQYIKWLESKAEELDEVYRILGLIHNENQQLRAIITDMDERMVDGASKGKAGSEGERGSASPSSMTVGGSLSEGQSDQRNALESISREISTRLMSLTTLPGSTSGEGRVDRPKYHPRNSHDGKGSGAGAYNKGKRAFKQCPQLQQHDEQYLAMFQHPQQQHPLHPTITTAIGDNSGHYTSHSLSTSPTDLVPTLSLPYNASTQSPLRAPLAADVLSSTTQTSMPYFSAPVSAQVHPHQPLTYTQPRPLSTSGCSSSQSLSPSPSMVSQDSQAILQSMQREMSAAEGPISSHVHNRMTALPPSIHPHPYAYNQRKLSGLQGKPIQPYMGMHTPQSMMYQPPQLLPGPPLGLSSQYSLQAQASQQVYWMADDRSCPSGRGRRSSMPTLHLLSMADQQQQQQQQQQPPHSQGVQDNACAAYEYNSAFGRDLTVDQQEQPQQQRPT